MTENNKAYYLAFFEINEDGDFYFEPYKGLNYTYRLFESPEKALEVIRKHLKLAIDTFARPKECARFVKDSMEEIYNELLTWDVGDSDEEDDIIFHIEEDLGNYTIEYSIRRVSFMNKDIDILIQELRDTETINLALRKQLKINESKIASIVSTLVKEGGSRELNEYLAESEETQSIKENEGE